MYNTYMHVRIYTHTYTYMHACTYIHTYIHTYIYTHKHIYRILQERENYVIVCYRLPFYILCSLD